MSEKERTEALSLVFVYFLEFLEGPQKREVCCCFFFFFCSFKGKKISCWLFELLLGNAFFVSFIGRLKNVFWGHLRLFEGFFGLRVLGFKEIMRNFYKNCKS